MNSERGMALVETLMAASLILIVAAGLLPLGIVATSVTANDGHLAARTTQYAQDKMEQLLTLSYGDGTTDTTVFPVSSTGGTGLAAGGILDPANPVAGYVDYLDVNGALMQTAGVAPPTGCFYMRLWQVASPSVNLKQITVTTLVAVKTGSVGRVPQSTLTTRKTFPF